MRGSNRRGSARSALLGAAASLMAVACAPRLAPLAGAPAPARFPGMLDGGHRLLTFSWEMNAGDVVARGQGAARVAPPDSVRLDFFLAGGMGSGAVVLIGDSLRLPPDADGVGMLPPPAMLWAVLGRLATDPVRDTVARRDGAILRADLGQPVRWRVTFDGDSLRRLERVEGGRVRAWVARAPDGHVRYWQESDRRSLDLVILKSVHSGPFDASLWSFP